MVFYAGVQCDFGLCTSMIEETDLGEDYEGTLEDIARSGGWLIEGDNFICPNCAKGETHARSF